LVWSDPEDVAVPDGRRKPKGGRPEHAIPLTDIDLL